MSLLKFAGVAAANGGGSTTYTYLADNGTQIIGIPPGYPMASEHSFSNMAVHVPSTIPDFISIRVDLMRNFTYVPSHSITLAGPRNSFNNIEVVSPATPVVFAPKDRLDILVSIAKTTPGEMTIPLAVTLDSLP